MKSHAIRRRLNESFGSKEMKSEDEIRREHEEFRRNSFDYAFNRYLNQYCKRDPKTVMRAVRDHLGNSLYDEDKEEIKRYMTIFSYDYSRLMEKITRIIKRLRPRALSDNESIRVGFETRHESEIGKNMVFLKRFPSMIMVARISTLTDTDIEKLQDDSMICREWIKRLVKFYLTKKLNFDEEEMVEVAHLLHDGNF